MTAFTKYCDSNRDTFETKLFDLLKIPSVSTDPQHRSDVRRAAEWVLGQLQALALKTELIEGDGHPIVYAESPPVEGAPIALVYGHYDVQPADPLHEWISPPFAPTVRDGNVYARGATDDKGQMLTHIFSTRAVLEVQGRLPIQLKFIVEGEEEIGSHSLSHFLATESERLACDCIIISDGSQFAPGQPAITYGLRGISSFEIRLFGPKQDLHSGSFGGAVTNPANTLAALLASLVDPNGHIRVPGFYDDVEPLSDREREQFQSLPFSERRFQEAIGVDGFSGESGYSTLERRWARPSFDIHGLWGGYQGTGKKTILPASAGAKFSFRLVPHQDPAKITTALEEYLRGHLPPGIRMELDTSQGASGFIASLDSPYMTAAVEAISQGFGHPPVFIREGGSIPIVTQFAKQLEADVLLVGWGRNDDNAHSPNEKFSLADFHRGIRASTALWKELAKINKITS
ncbi:MAG: dipeptidase [Pirellulales bacterium]|nr:dipeptidase [Pirellulales bacterium]